MGVLDFLRGDADQDRFAARVIERLKQKGWPHHIQYDRSRFEINLGGEAGKIYLGNIFRDWLKFPKAERLRQLDEAIAFVFELEDDKSWEAVRDDLLPIVRPRVFFENTGLTASHDWTIGPTFLQKPLAGPLSILLTIDQKHSFATANTELFNAWGRSFDEVLAIALDNLRARSPCRFERQEGGFYLSNFGDWSDASRILIPSLFGQLDLRGDPVVIVIVREGLVVAGSLDVEALKAMAAFAQDEFLSATRPISCAPLVFRAGRWEPFQPEDVSLVALKQLWARQLVRDYGQQGEMLEEHFAQLALDRFLPPLELTFDGVEPRTWTSWTDGARAILPKADAVVLIDSGGRALPRLWRDVEAICGPFVPQGATYPQRYDGEHWPNPEAWTRLFETTTAPAWLPVA